MKPIKIRVQADANGNWQANVRNAFDERLHPVIIQDESGNQINTFLNVSDEEIVEPEVKHDEQITQDIPKPEQDIPRQEEVKPEVKIITETKIEKENFLIDRVEEIIPFPLFIFIIFLFFLILILIRNNIRLSRVIDDQESSTKTIRAQQHTIFALRFSILILLLIILASVILNSKTKIVDQSFLSNVNIPIKNIPLINKIHYASKKQEPGVRITGQVQSPLTGVGIADINLSVANVSIRTQEGGYYIFNNVDSGAILSINHPELLLTIKRELENLGDLYFDLDLYNLLINITYLESMGKVGEIYDYLTRVQKEDISRDEFIENYEKLFLAEHLNKQYIKIRKQEFFKKKQEFKIILENETREKVYEFKYEEGEWRLN